MRLTRSAWLEMLAEAWARYPEEACGLLLGPGPGEVRGFVPVANAAASSRIFELDPRGFLRAERRADDEGSQIVGVMHSHTHTAAFPSVTDLAEATKPLVPPSWHWVIVSLGWGHPEVRSFAVDAHPTGAADRFPRAGDVGHDDSPAGIGEQPILLTD